MKTIITAGLMLAASIIVISTIYSLLVKIRKLKLPPVSWTSFILYTAIALGFSLAGYNIGLFTGLSLTPVIQFVVPAILTFITGFVTYLFVQKDFRQEGALRGTLMVVMFNVGLLTGGGIGMFERGNYETDSYNQDLRKELFMKRVEYYIKYRSDTGMRNITPPFIKTIKKDSTVVDPNQVPDIGHK